MDRKQQLFAKIRLIAYALVIAIFAIAGVSLFISAQFKRAMYTDSNVHLADAQSNLGFCYITGQGVPQNTVQAIYWWKKAAEQGHQNAIKNLEICRANGDC